MIFEIIKQINSEGTTVLLVEQNAKAALEVADYGYVLETGRISLLVQGMSYFKTIVFERPIWAKHSNRADSRS